MGANTQFLSGSIKSALLRQKAKHPLAHESFRRLMEHLDFTLKGQLKESCHVCERYANLHIFVPDEKEKVRKEYAGSPDSQ